MATYKLKPIKWTETDSVITAEVVNHVYTIRNIIGEISVHYHDKMTGNSSSKVVDSVEDGKDWVENTHLPSELKKWFEVAK